MAPSFKVMSLTDAAATRIKGIMADAERPIAGLRVGVKNGGCAGMSYTMEYAEERKAGEDVVEDKGVRVFIDPKAVLFLLGTEWISRPRSCRRSSCSTIPTRPRPAAAASRSRSRPSTPTRSTPPTPEGSVLRGGPSPPRPLGAQATSFMVSAEVPSSTTRLRPERLAVNMQWSARSRSDTAVSPRR